jgi:MFS family permease
MAHAGVRSSGTLIALRLLLGAAEAGFTQSAFYYMSLLYPKFALGFRMGLFTGMYAVAGAFAGLIAYGLLKVQTASIHGWQVVFLVEGGVTVLVGVVAFVVLPGDVGKAWFLRAREREHAVGRMERDLAGMQEEESELGARENAVKVRDLVDVVKDWKKMLIIVSNITAVLVSLGGPWPLSIFADTDSTDRQPTSPSRPLPPSYHLSFKAWTTRA